MQPRRQALDARLAFLERDRVVAVAVRQVEKRRQQALRVVLLQLAHQLAHRDLLPAPLVVLEAEHARTPMAGEVDAGGLLGGDRPHQVVERAQLGRG